MTGGTKAAKSKSHIFAWYRDRKDAATDRSQRQVLRILVDFADESGRTIRGQKTIAAEAGCSEKTVRRALRRLEKDSKLISRRHRYNERGKRTSDVIQLALSTRQEELTDKMTASEPTTGHSVLDYRTQCPWNESVLNPILPPTPKGESKEDGIRKRFSEPQVVERWARCYDATGESEKAEKARRNGYVDEVSKWPPEPSARGDDPGQGLAGVKGFEKPPAVRPAEPDPSRRTGT